MSFDSLPENLTRVIGFAKRGNVSFAAMSKQNALRDEVEAAADNEGSLQRRQPPTSLRDETNGRRQCAACG
jgi:hypothetical protein